MDIQQFLINIQHQTKTVLTASYLTLSPNFGFLSALQSWNSSCVPIYKARWSRLLVIQFSSNFCASLWMCKHYLRDSLVSSVLIQEYICEKLILGTVFGEGVLSTQNICFWKLVILYELSPLSNNNKLCRHDIQKLVIFVNSRTHSERKVSL